MSSSSSHALLLASIFAYYYCPDANTDTTNWRKPKQSIEFSVAVVSAGEFEHTSLAWIRPHRDRRRDSEQQQLQSHSHHQQQRALIQDSVADNLYSHPGKALVDCLAHSRAFGSVERLYVVHESLKQIVPTLEATTWQEDEVPPWCSSDLYFTLILLDEGAFDVALPPELADRVALLVVRAQLQHARLLFADLDQFVVENSWKSAVRRAIEYRESKFFDAPVFRAAEPLFDALTEYGRRRDAADQLTGMLSGSSLDQWRSPLTLEFGDAPSEVRQPLDSIRALAEIKHSVESEDSMNGIDGRQLRERMEPLETSPEFREAALRMMCSLSFRELICGDASDALDLLPDAGGTARCQGILRDIKAIAAGNGSLETWPAQRALVKSQGGTLANLRGPPALIAPRQDAQSGGMTSISESAVTGLPELSVSMRVDLPVWEDPAELETPIRQQIEEITNRWSSQAEFERLQRTTSNAVRYYRRRFDLFDEGQIDITEEPCLAEVRRLMGRDLELDEEFRARLLCLEGNPPADVAEAIHDESASPVPAEE